ncbi:Flp family type IVb pilin [Mariniblastus sp.]|nr:Flp family type IVb pilin [Mariniblastus sp.]
MKYLKTIAQRFIRDEDGPTAVEYAIMLALIVLVCIASVIAIGQSAEGVFEAVADGFAAN